MESYTKEQARQVVIILIEVFYAKMLENGILEYRAKKILDDVNQAYIDMALARMAKEE